MNRKYEYLTVGQLRKAMRSNSYLLVRFASGYQMAINSRILKLLRNKKKIHGNRQTEFVSYMPCDFQTYITYKHPFL